MSQRGNRQREVLARQSFSSSSFSIFSTPSFNLIPPVFTTLYLQPSFTFLPPPPLLIPTSVYAAHFALYLLSFSALCFVKSSQSREAAHPESRWRPMNTYSKSQGGIKWDWQEKMSPQKHRIQQPADSDPQNFLLLYFLYTPSNPPAQLSLFCFTSACSALIKLCLVVLKFSLALPTLMAADSPLSSSLIQTDRPCFFSSAVAAEHCGHPVHENKQQRDH